MAEARNTHRDTFRYPIPPGMDGYYLINIDGDTQVRYFKAGDAIPREAHTAFQRTGGALKVGERIIAHATLTRLSD